MTRAAYEPIGGSPFESTYVPLQWGQPGVLHEPSPDSDGGHVGLVYFHPTADYTNWPGGLLRHNGETHLTNRGYRVLLSSTREGTRGGFSMHDLLPDVAAAVDYLYDHSEIERVVLMGQSGGAQLMALYQNVAENGPEVWQHDEVLYEIPDAVDGVELDSLRPADGLVVFDCHLGYGRSTLMGLGPQVVDEDDPRPRLSELDMYDPDNGYAPPETSYSEEFLERYFAGQADRMNALIERATHRLQEVDAGHGRYADDEPFLVPDRRNRIARVDERLLTRTQEEWPILHADGSRKTRVAEEVTPEEDDFGEDLELAYAADSEPPLEYKGQEVLETSVRDFLSTYSIRTTGEFRLTEDSIEGIDWHSSYTSIPANFAEISVPLLQLGMTGSNLVVQTEEAFRHTGMDDAELVYIEGGDHFYMPIEAKYGDTVARTYDYVSEWIDERF